MTRFGTSVDLAAELALPAIDHRPHQQRDVLAALAQRRQRDGEDVEPIVEILPEAPLGHGAFEIAVGGRDDADVRVERPSGSHAFERPVLQHAQQLGLHVDAEFADLVQEERAAVRQLEAAGPASRRRR